MDEDIGRARKPPPGADAIRVQGLAQTIDIHCRRHGARRIFGIVAEHLVSRRRRGDRRNGIDRHRQGPHGGFSGLLHDGVRQRRLEELVQMEIRFLQALCSGPLCAWLSDNCRHAVLLRRPAFHRALLLQAGNQSVPFFQCTEDRPPGFRKEFPQVIQRHNVLIS